MDTKIIIIYSELTPNMSMFVSKKDYKKMLKWLCHTLLVPS